ncbi:DUF998 domain-containing protein [Couchioplanes caeruleus]|uniref:DUF998 domain-containing protein n=1 Tax=Couchioplanes caeruleus TaxID=56438 RepID=UPI0020BDECB4|nr:DUF998 domain-containing protein [Couchioplanes caeruleus]UQU66278.1 DUF998 domain-containing protein [Couchioplanes caeruleus]
MGDRPHTRVEELTPKPAPIRPADPDRDAGPDPDANSNRHTDADRGSPSIRHTDSDRGSPSIRHTDSDRDADSDHHAGSRRKDPTGNDTGSALSAAAVFAVVVGALIMLVALVNAPGSWLQGYVSEAGTAVSPLATAYRWGLVLLAAGVALLGVALRPASRLLLTLLGSAGVLAATSGAVPCTDQCPLPPFESTTVSDVVHTAASIVGMAVLAGAMLTVALTSLFTRVMRQLALVATVLTVPLGGALGLTMLFVGRGLAGAVLERILLIVAVSWLSGTALLTLLRSSVKV